MKRAKLLHGLAKAGTVATALVVVVVGIRLAKMRANKTNSASKVGL